MIQSNNKTHVCCDKLNLIFKRIKLFKKGNFKNIINSYDICTYTCKR